MTPDELRRAAELLHKEGVMQRMTHSPDRAREFQALAAKLRAMAEADAGWQPIETAPRDGTLIVLGKAEWTLMPVAKWGDVDAEDGTFGAWLIEDPMFCAGVEDGVLGWNEDIEDGSMPTHWRPLPPPPEAK